MAYVKKVTTVNGGSLEYYLGQYTYIKTITTDASGAAILPLTYDDGSAIFAKIEDSWAVAVINSGAGILTSYPSRRAYPSDLKSVTFDFAKGTNITVILIGGSPSAVPAVGISVEIKVYGY